MYKRERKKRGYLMFIVDSAIYLLTIGALLSLLITYVAGYVSPETIYLFSLFAIAAPIIYLLNFLLLLYWIVRWNVVWILLILLLLLLGINAIGRVFQPTISKEYKADERRDGIKIVTYNVSGFKYNITSAMWTTMPASLDFVNEYKPDILSLQEVQLNKDNLSKSKVSNKLKSLKYSASYLQGPPTYQNGLSIYSKYRILDHDVIMFPNRKNFGMWVDLLIAKGDTLRVFNTHLQSTTVTQKDRKYIEEHDFEGEEVGEFSSGVKDIALKMRESSYIRAAQVDTIARLIHNSPYPTVVCGDFNDTPMSYTYRTIRGDLKDSFVEKGSGISSTFNGLFNILRIDYILHSDDYTTESYLTPYRSNLSDHNPVVVTVKRLSR